LIIINLLKLCLKPAKLWLLDEPLTFLDDAAKDIFKTMLENHLQNNNMAIIATHQLLDISYKTKKIILGEEYA
jgi:heme exporter protein A